MIKKFVSTLSFTALVALASASIGLAQGTTTPPASGTKPATGAAHQETAKTPAAQTPAAKAPAATTTATTTAAKPATPTWVIVEEDWWSPIQFNFSNALRNAEGKIRARDEKLAADEIDRAASWLRDAEVVADKSYQGDRSRKTWN